MLQDVCFRGESLYYWLHGRNIIFDRNEVAVTYMPMNFPDFFSMVHLNDVGYRFFPYLFVVFRIYYSSVLIFMSHLAVYLLFSGVDWTL